MTRTIEVILKSIPVYLGLVISYFTLSTLYGNTLKFEWENTVYTLLIIMLFIQIFCIRIVEICNIYYLWRKNRQHIKAMKTYLSHVEDKEVAKAISKFYATHDWDYNNDPFSESILSSRPSHVQFDYLIRHILTSNIYLYILEGKKSTTTKLNRMFSTKGAGETLIKLKNLPEKTISNYIQIKVRNNYHSKNDYIFEDSDDKDDYNMVETLINTIRDDEGNRVFDSRWFENYFEPMTSVDRPEKDLVFFLLTVSLAVTIVMLFINLPKTLLFVVLLVSLYVLCLLQSVLFEYVENDYKVDFRSESWKIK